MTEVAWNTCADPLPMWEYLRGRAGNRKCRLLATASLRRLAEWFREDAPVRELLLGAAEAGEKFSDGAMSAADFEGLHDQFQFRTRLGALSDAQRFAGEVVSGLFAPDPSEAAYAITFAADAVGELDEDLPPIVPSRRDGELAAQAALVREVFGNAFRPVAFGTRWRSVDVVGLAMAIYEDRAFDRMPILADALMDAGCDNVDIIEHCRGPGPHVRGCWVVDLILGKE